MWLSMEQIQSSTDSTDMSEEEEYSDALPDQVSEETHLDETAQFSEYFALKGSSSHEDCQKALRKCKQLQLHKENINLRVIP